MRYMVDKQIKGEFEFCINMIDRIYNIDSMNEEYRYKNK